MRNNINRVEHLYNALKGLTKGQLELVEQVVDQLSKPYILIERLETSDIVSDCLLHCCLSKKADRWHYELVEIPKSLLEEA